MCGILLGCLVLQASGLVFGWMGFLLSVSEVAVASWLSYAGGLLNLLWFFSELRCPGEAIDLGLRVFPMLGFQ